MVIKDDKWIGLNCGDTLVNNPSICKSETMTLMYKGFVLYIPIALS
ncbi:MAG: hypothetical protein ACFFCE_06075 [Promethearchaeota archaeon]